ncbi:vanadium-dependent haloperoxidase [Tumidithrix elongata RA019]|uniref:Vanadium-dependent haloperoxidase n=1 Tax=Tumidithrix elongata BACA0141 TaxID=2716417 RepID=A0AAW9Q370_9CYAN|nr:vanadium-dependent haloperoxidase [Tumidithrix elongata RA019]
MSQSWLAIRRFVLFAFAALFVVVAIPGLLPKSWSSTSQSFAQSTSRGDAVTAWNAIAVTTTQGPANPQARALGIVHAAVFDAVNAIDRRYTPYLVDTKAPGASAEAATAAAAHSILVKLYPAQQAALDKSLSDSLAKIADGKAKKDGLRVGKEVAEKVFAIRDKDGWNTKVDYKPGTEPGAWQPTPPANAAAVYPNWPTLTPFSFKSTDQFTTPPPPALDSPEYIKSLSEVQNIGGKNSKIRTADQTAAAIFWTVNTPVIWNAAARSAAIVKGNTLIENARLFALLNFAISDAYVAGYAVKYKYNLWRPITAIRAGSPGIPADPKWEPLLITPAHPDYISGHSVTSGAAERVLTKFFGSDDVKFNLTFPANAVTRYYTSYSQLVQENENARVWGGLHTRIADVQGTALGRQVGDYTIQNYLKPL